MDTVKRKNLGMPKKIIPLSDMQVNKAKPKSKAYKLTDGGGLYLLVTVSGGKLWRYDYRGRYQKMMAQMVKCEVLVLDDLLISPITQDAQRELLRIVEDRYGRKSTIITSQLPIKAWHNAMQDPTVADAIMDRIVHNSHKLELKGESMRKKRASVTNK